MIKKQLSVFSSDSFFGVKKKPQNSVIKSLYVSALTFYRVIY